jgi:PTS system ascorbate-specific IIC component
MFDCVSVWPIFTILMKFLGYAGIGIIVVGLLAIPQLQYRKNPEGYFLITKDYEEYKKRFGE